MKCVIFLCCMLAFPFSYNAGSHTLWMFATYIKGETPFPEFSIVTMLDDIQLGYYDSNEKKILYRGLEMGPKRSFEAADMDYFRHYFVEYMHGRMKNRATYLSNYFNHTNDVYVFQRAAGCELLENDQPGGLASNDAYNGEIVEKEYYDVTHDTLHTDKRWPEMVNEVWSHKYPLRYGYIYHPNCIALLRKHLEKETNRVLKKVKPRVRLIQKALVDSGGAQLTCLATGFYPRHINLTLLRDGQPVSDHLMTGGEALPNGDETYQMRKRLDVSAEELHQHQYTCTVIHLSLDNKLDIGLDHNFASGPGSIVFPVVVVVVVVVVMVMVAGFSYIVRGIMLKKRHADRSSQTSLKRCDSASPDLQNQTEDIPLQEPPKDPTN
ncbi:zinc-alpha-2-glycoprotein-like [Brachyhypopomus gauderio]|uniref:zinc-alpha-2-glycoprotein-like n=1 Tax=Brachyhypopomus gauderio TaxID=698409 RepID=UPI004041C733